jgi:voltage-gated potassium channel Kch
MGKSLFPPAVATSMLRLTTGGQSIFLHTEEDHNSSEKAARSVIFWIGVASVVATLTFAFVSFFFYVAPCVEQEPETISDRIYRLFALFEISEANVHLDKCYGGPIEVARFIGPVATGALVVGVLREFLRDRFLRLRLWWFSGHTVIIGFGEKGKVRAVEAASQKGARVVAIERAPGETSHAVANRHGVPLIIGDARQSGVLSRVHLRRAARFVVATGDDSRNLSIAQYIAEQVPRGTAGNREIEVSISDPVIRRALDAGATDGLIDAFALEDIAAHRLCKEVRFFAVADLLGQRRMHIVMLGFDRVGISVAGQLLRSGQITDLGMTRITILSVNPVLTRDLLLLSYPGIEAVADIAYVAADPRVVATGGPLMADIEAVVPITAIIALGDRGADSLLVALAVREASRRTGLWMAPIFFGIEHACSLRGFPRAIGGERRFSKVLHPFEISADLCKRKYAEERDAVAAEIHEAYRRAFAQSQADGQKPSSARQALVPWRQLTRTYRQSNRRAADHIAAKLVSAGCVVPPGAPSASGHFDLLTDEAALERLAALEHRVWAAERQLDGWRPGKTRDDSRWIHDCLIPYAELREETKELDRAQIRELNAARIPRVPAEAAKGKTLIRFDLWVGVIGTRSLSRAEGDWARGALSKTILPRLLAAHSDHNITLLSPLAPGADLIATKTILAGLANEEFQHRLIVTEAVPIEEVVAQFAASWRNGAVGDLDLSAEAPTWPEARKELKASIEAVESGAACERIVELNPVALGAEQEACEAGYQRQNAYIVQRAHVVIAIVKSPVSGEPGGTGEAIAWRRDRSAMPETMPRYARRPNGAGHGFPGLIIVDVGERKIADDPSGA